MPLPADVNLQLATSWADHPGGRLVTRLETAPLRGPGNHEILVEMLGVGLHGSFWLATHPERLHPRWQEFMQEGRFVFGNGGVGRVVAAGRGIAAASGVAPGDFVAMFGHVPCDEPECISCRQTHRYVECEYGTSSIIGHGKGGVDGTLARYALLPPETWGVCFKAQEKPDRQNLLPHLYAFLTADVRNALTRHPEGLRRKRALIIGAGLSGSLAAAMLLQENPGCRILALDIVPQRAKALADLAPDRIAALDIGNTQAPEAEAERIGQACREWFAGHGPDLVLDCASEDATRLWASPHVLPPGALCIVFGFGMQGLALEHSLLQRSGLCIQMCKGVGDRENRAAALELLKAPGPCRDVVLGALDGARRVNTLEALEALVREFHEPPKPLHRSPVAWLDMFHLLETPLEGA